METKFSRIFTDCSILLLWCKYSSWKFVSRNWTLSNTEICHCSFLGHIFFFNFIFCKIYNWFKISVGLFNTLRKVIIVGKLYLRWYWDDNAEKYLEYAKMLNYFKFCKYYEFQDNRKIFETVPNIKKNCLINLLFHNTNFYAIEKLLSLR